ncbi:MAG: CAP domain-containing protein [Desulfuromonadales bacterium]|nr:CAP domain-containing protein [Desulfuromonadales bacterium]
MTLRPLTYALHPLTLFLLLAALLLPVQAMASESRQELLDRQCLQLWQRINEARHNPQAALQRLGIPFETAVTALGADAWILQGLPPLAWDAQLQTAASAHGGDMLARLYYSSITPEGVGPLERIAATGYQASFEDEALTAVAFTAPVAIEEAVDFMFDRQLYDELTAAPGVRRVFMSDDATEIGMAAFAESLALLAGQPNLYLLVADVAAPLVPRPFVVGVAAADSLVVARRYPGDALELLPTIAGGLFQAEFPRSGAEYSAYTAEGGMLRRVPVYNLAAGANRYVDLRR